jgi:nucleotide-binding universal stress UspA family protein
VHREVAVGVRDPHEAAGALAFAFEEAALRGADLVAVHTWYWLPSGQAGALRPADPERFAAEATRQLAVALEDWRGKYPDVRVRQDVIRGHPARVLASYSARTDLVVLGRHGHPTGPGPGIGSVQHAVLDHAHGPVAIVPAGD